MDRLVSSMNKVVLFFVSLILTLSAFQVRAVDYQLPDVDGKIQSLDQYLGKWVVVNYWATWCGTCKKEFADLIDLHNESKHQNIVVVGINYEIIGAQQLKAFIKEHEIPFQVLRSKPVAVTPLGNVPAIPTTYIVDPEGVAIAGEVGIVTRQQLEDFINRQKSREKYAKYAVKQGAKSL